MEAKLGEIYSKSDVEKRSENLMGSGGRMGAGTVPNPPAAIYIGTYNLYSNSIMIYIKSAKSKPRSSNKSMSNKSNNTEQ